MLNSTCLSQQYTEMGQGVSWGDFRLNGHLHDNCPLGQVVTKPWLFPKKEKENREKQSRAVLSLIKGTNKCP